MTAATDQVAASIQAAAGHAAASLQQATDYTKAAQTAALTNIGLNAFIPVAAETINAPPYTPNINLTTQFNTDFASQWAGMETWVRGLMSDYIHTYFPSLDPNIGLAENTWLLSVINNGYLGIPVPVEQAIWDRARARDTIEALRMEDEAVTQLSARGFSMPPGILANRLQMIQQEAANKSSTIAREQAIKQAEMAAEFMKFAIGESTKLRLGIAAALADYMRAWMELPKAAAEIAKAKAEVARIMWDSSSNYIHALSAKAAVHLDADKADLSAFLEQQKMYVEVSLGELRNRTDAAIKAADAMGLVAGAYASTLNTISQVGDVTTTSL